MRIKFFILTILILAILTSGCNNDTNVPKNNSEYKKVRMVMTTSGTGSGINTLVAHKLSQLLAEASNGNVIVEVYDNDKLAGGNTTKGVKMIADGSVDLAVYTSGTLSTLDSRISVATLPWTFNNYQEVRKIIDDTGSAYYKKLLAEQGLVYLGYTHNGFRQISNNRNPVHQPEDLDGMKVRILGNEGYRLFFWSFNAIPLSMSRSEMSVALRQGNIDGHDMGLFQSRTDKLNETEKYLTIWNYAYETYIFVANSKTFDQLEPKTQELLLQKTQEACDWGKDWLEEHEREILKTFIKNGVIVTELSSEELEPFKERVQPLINQLKEQYGEEACRAFNIN